MGFKHFQDNDDSYDYGISHFQTDEERAGSNAGHGGIRHFQDDDEYDDWPGDEDGGMHHFSD